MARVSIQDIAKAVANKYNLSQNESEAFVSAFFDVINEGLHADKIVKVKGLGTFKVIDVRERESVNVNTGERVVIESHGKITFTPDPVMRDLVNKPFAQFETVILNDGVDLDLMNSARLPEDEVENLPTNASGTCGQKQEETYGNVEDAVVADVNGADADDVSEDIEEDTECVSESVVRQDESDDSIPELVESDAENSLTAVEEKKTVEIVSEKTDTDTVDVIDVAEDIEENAADKKDDSKTVSSESQNNSGQNVCEDSDDSSRLKTVLSVVLSLFVLTIVFAAGYYFGRNSVEPIVRYKSVNVVNKHVKRHVQKDSLQNKDSSAIAVSTESRDKVSSHSSDAVGVMNVNAGVKQAENSRDSQSLKAARTKVRTGAYRIVGTLKIVKVKKGETLDKISKFYLGDGMECYIQVHNGITEVKEGMSLKIPKLVSKFRR